MEDKIGQFEGVRWFARLVNAYDEALDFSSAGDFRRDLVKDFQSQLLRAIMDPTLCEFDGLLRIIAPDEFDLLLREREAKDREREAKKVSA